MHKTNAANEELVISLFYGREVQERKPIYRLLQHYNSLSNKMDNSLLAVRDINHKYIVVAANTKALPGTTMNIMTPDNGRFPQRELQPIDERGKA